jgi:hypothetical protein
VFEQVLADPDFLTELPGAAPDETHAEGLVWAASDAHERHAAATEMDSQVHCDPDAGDAVVLDVQPVGDGEGLAVPAGCCPFPG